MKPLSEFALAQAKAWNMTEEQYRAEMRNRSAKVRPENRYFSKNPKAASKIAKAPRKLIGGDASG